MELVQCTLEIAFNVLEQKSRIIKATKGNESFKVEWINLNNQTFFLSRNKNSGLQQNCEDYTFYIQVPKNAKTVY